MSTPRNRVYPSCVSTRDGCPTISRNSSVCKSNERDGSLRSRSSSPLRIQSNSDSMLIETSTPLAHPLNRLGPIDQTNATSPSSSLDLPTDLSVSFRARARSFSNIHDSYKEQHDETSTIRNSEPSSWWKKIEILPRPWGHEGVDDFNIPDEQREGWECTRKSVAQVAASVLGTAGLVAKEILVTGLQLANFVPIPGLQPIASTLLKIWDAVQLVGTNRLAFLRLTQRCANALLSVWQEIEDAGRAAIEELSQPLDSLNRVFTNVLKLAEQQSSIPFLMRYLKRNEIVSRITELNKEVVDALQMFGTSVQIRTLKLVQLSEEHRQADAKVIKALITAQLPSGLSSSPARRDTLVVPGLPPSSPQPPLPTIIPSIHELYLIENSQDNQRDVDDLRQLMRPHCERNEPAPDLLLHREFIESGIDALRRMSKGWTITKYEVEPEQKIGMGFFSDVYKGTWKGQTVAIKVLAELTPRKLFVREMGIWKALRHQNVIELFGASSATGEAPWFFVSPYEKNGNLVDFMRRCTFGKERNRLISEDKKSMVLKEKDLYRFMMEIAEGMAYLHARGILHGDLKASNVLVDDDIHCVISDFGQSELKSEVCRISGMPLPGGTLRWQAPELLLGHGELTSAVDIYAYAISCIEVLSFGQLPWPLSDDDAVRYLVLKEKSRPRIPAACTLSPMQELIRKCWDSKPERRPSFAAIALEQRWMLQAMEKEEAIALLQHHQMRAPTAEEYFLSRSRGISSLSPSLIPLSPEPEDQFKDTGGSAFHALHSEEDETAVTPPYISKREEMVVNTEIKVPQPVIFSPSIPASPASSSFYADTTLSVSQEYLTQVGVYSSLRTYRISLDRKEYHSSLSLPLWDPTPVELGDVGYLSKPRGKFRRHDRRTATQKGLDAVAGLLMFGKGRTNVPVSRRYSFPLRAGNKGAYMCTEGAEYQYLKTLESPKQWFKAYVDKILGLYGAQHSLQKEDLFLVIGALQATNYGLFVGYNYPEGQVHFNVFPSAKRGDRWGAFTTDAKGPDDGNGPIYNESKGEPTSASKVSQVGDPPRTVLLARLRFKPDVMEPTSL
ncbi:hypothetical protein BDQ17DRAFT_1360497 [Cyathus striatus]|nr:hypothetical protein BDQ17DRAFT_1360497 [Cyathus striatus]